MLRRFRQARSLERGQVQPGSRPPSALISAGRSATTSLATRRLQLRPLRLARNVSGTSWHSANGASATVCIPAPGPATENGNERDRHSQQDKDTVLTALRRDQPSVTSLTRRPAPPLAATPVDAVAVSSHNQPPSPTLLPRIFYHLAMPASVPHGRPWPAHIDRHATI